jgi:hypothetical protein
MADLVFQPPTSTDFIGMLGYINNLTDVGSGGMFWTIMLIVFGGILFLMMKSFSTERSLGITAIIICILAWLFRIINWVNDYTVTTCTILMIFGIYLLVKESAPYEQ